MKEKEPLFVTEDGVEVFEGEEYFYILKPFYSNVKKLHASKINCSKNTVRFKYKANANECLWRNKRLFSYNDIEKFQSGGEGVCYDIKAIAKERSEE